MVSVLLDKVKTLSKVTTTTLAPKPPSSFTRLKALVVPAFRPAGISKNPARIPADAGDCTPPTSSAPMEIDRATSPPLALDRMDGIDHGGLETSKHALANVRPDRATQVSPTRSSTRQGSSAARDSAHVAEGSSSSPMRQGTDREQGGTLAPTRQGAGGTRGGMVIQTRRRCSRSNGRSQDRTAPPNQGDKAAPPASYAASTAAPALVPTPTPNPTPAHGSSRSLSRAGFGSSSSSRERTMEIRAPRKLRKSYTPTRSPMRSAPRRRNSNTPTAKRNPGGWYVAFCLPRDGGEAGAKKCKTLQIIRKKGLQIFGFTVKPHLAERENPGTFCHICCRYGHVAWRCFGCPVRCTFCAGVHVWTRHQCKFKGCSKGKGEWCSYHETLQYFNCDKEHSSGRDECAA
jgi:hypothetical protein